MFEALRTESMQVNGLRSIAAVDAIKSILEASHTEENGEIHKQPMKTVKCSEIKADIDQSKICTNDDVINANKTDTTSNGLINPENEGPQKLNASQREQMSKLVVPGCTCVLEKNSDHCDVHLHRLYFTAGIVLSDFLSQYEMEADAGRILYDLQMKYPEFLKLRTLNNTTDLNKQVIISPDNSSLSDFMDPHVKFLSLEAMCLQAESLLYHQKFSGVQQVWASLKALEKKGFWNNVIHSDILMTRIALCQARSFMFSVQPISVKVNDKKTLEGTKELCSLTDLPDTLSCKKVTFVDTMPDKAKNLDKCSKDFEQENVYPHDNPLMPQEDSLGIPKSGILTPLKSKSFLENQETSQKLMETLILSAKKQKLKQVLGTPLTGHQAKLDFLMESDHEEDVMFPAQKPVTPKSVKSKNIRKMRSRKGSHIKTTSSDSDHDSNIVPVTPICKLTLDSSDAMEPTRTCTVGEECNKSSDKSKLNRKLNKKQNINADLTESSQELEIINHEEDNSCTRDSDSVKGRALSVMEAIKCQVDTKSDKSVENVDTDKLKEKIEIPASKTVTPEILISGKGQNVRTRSRKALKCNLTADPDKHGNDGTTMIHQDSVTKHTENTDNEQIDVRLGTVNTAVNVEKNSTMSTQVTGKGTKRKKKGGGEICSGNSKVHTRTHLQTESVSKSNANKKENGMKAMVSSVLELKGDIFDFECSPLEKSKSKTRAKGKCKKSTQKNRNVDDDEIVALEKSGKQGIEVECKKSSSKKNVTLTTRNRRNLRSDIETARTVTQHTNFDLTEGLHDRFERLDASIELCNDQNSSGLSATEFLDLEVEGWECPKVLCDPCDPDSNLDQVTLPTSIPSGTINEFEPIEIMRGGVRKRERGKHNSSKPSTSLSIEGVKCRLPDPGETEVVRSSGSLSMKSLMDRISVDTSADAASGANGSSNGNLQHNYLLDRSSSYINRVTN